MGFDSTVVGRSWLRFVIRLLLVDFVVVAIHVGLSVFMLHVGVLLWR